MSTREAGVALAALLDALILVLTATGDPRAMLLINWLKGSCGVDPVADRNQITVPA
ncbi:hypothetical protein [Mesorhizobium sp. WSM3873]|uniref:hypothetical protein n=1 Tax=Mesorhizobium sp. WSM3873 TaxID=1854056 RepID=UPI0012E9CDD4|nr:hypothetical protein [Mesorhizobium sp. WSM3873]